MESINKIRIIILSAILVIFMQMSQITYAINSNNSKNVVNFNENKPFSAKINFEEILTKAKEHSYDLKIADFNTLIAKQGIRSARSEYFPKLNIMAGTEYTKNYRDIRDTTVMSIGEAFINPYTRYQSLLGITLTYNLFDFGVRKGNLDIAKEDVSLKTLKEQEQLQEMNLTLVDTYTKLLLAKKQIDINKQILEIEQKSLEQKNRLLSAKEISQTELNDQTVKVERVKQKISELYGIMAESAEWLSFYTGEDYDIEHLKVDEIKKSDFDVLEYTDYTKSLIWQIYEKELKKKDLELKVAKRNYLPKVTAYSRYYIYGSDHSSYNDSFGNIEPSNFSVGGSIVMPVFDGFRNSSNVQKVSLELKQLQVERDKAIAQLMTRLAVMRSNLMYLDKQIDANNQMLEELTNKEKSIHRLVSKKVISPIEQNDIQVEVLEQQIELEKNKTTANSIKRGIQILTQGVK